MLPLLRALSLLTLFAMPLSAQTQQGIVIGDPYARIVQGSGVAYFRIDNLSAVPDRLIAVQSDIGTAMLMTNETDANGMMQMRMAPDGFAVEPGASRLLQPAGDHVMLMGLSDAPAEGATLTLTLTFAEAGQITLSVPVMNKRRTPPGPEPTPFDSHSGSGD